MKFSVANHALVPANTEAIAWMRDRQIGEPITLSALTDSEMKFRGFVFMTLNKAAEAAGVTIDEFRARLQIESGRAELIEVDAGRVWAVKSMNVMTMSHVELKEFWDEAKVRIEAMLPTFAPTDKIDELQELLNS